MSFDYFYGQQSDLFTFYRVPKVLFTNERFWNISADAKMLYGILLDRMSLSAKNGWICDIIPKSSAKPGDLIFFQGTYDTSGASHVGIYVGNGMMIHCGNPISYASIESNYWQQHFYCFGRIRN